MNLRTKLLITAVLTLAAFVPADILEVAAKRPTHPGAQDATLYVLYATSLNTSAASAVNTIASSPSPVDKRVYAIRQDTRWIRLLAGDKTGRELPTFLSEPRRLAVGAQGQLFVLGSAEIKVINAQGFLSGKFAVPATATSIAALSDGSVAVAAVDADTLLTVFDSSGKTRQRLGKVKRLDAGDPWQNIFLNAGLLAAGGAGELYHVTTFSPTPTVQKFSKEGKLLLEFPIRGAAVDLQLERANDFLTERRAGTVGGYFVVRATAVDPATGNLWVGLNGGSAGDGVSPASGVLYEFSPGGEKLGEYALVVKSASGAESVLTDVKEITVNSRNVHVLTSQGQVYQFEAGRKSARHAPGRKQPSAFSWTPLASKLVPASWTAGEPSAPHPAQTSCPVQQNLACAANCPGGSQDVSVDCGANLAERTQPGEHIIGGQCTISPATSNLVLGGCAASATYCNTANGERTTISMNLTCMAAPTPTPPSETGESCGVDCETEYGPRWFCYEGMCNYMTPVLVDVEGDGFALTNGVGGVDLALREGGARRRVSWTIPGTDDAWLALDRDGDGTIDGAHELFGNFTPQPPSPEKNGFRALAVFDGNNDDRIDAADSVFPHLRLWQDVNHDGASQPSELHTLPALDVARIHLNYKKSKREDEFGNLFAYRAKVDDARRARVGRWAWDVILVPGR